MSYDGHGRLKTRHYPIEDALTETTLIYNADDSVQQSIDPRNVITSFSYNDPRGLLTGIAYQVPAGSTIPSTPNVTYGYDNLGNRTQMTDGLGSVAYEYNQLSQMTAETRRFNDNLPNAPLSNNRFKLEYGYNLSGGLKFVTDPYGERVDYTHDKTGRLRKVSGTAYGDNTTGEYLDGIEYRSWGAVKQMTYETDDNAQVKMEYDNRQRVSRHEVDSSIQPNNLLKKADFTYFNDSRPQAMDNIVKPEFDRTFTYDHAGRLKANQIGGGQTIPYTQTIQYDAFSQMTNRATNHWTAPNSFTAAYTNGREQTAGVVGTIYDAVGNMTHTGSRNGSFQTTVFDAANRQAVFTSQQKVSSGRFTYGTYKVIMTKKYDGDGQALKMIEETSNHPNWQIVWTEVKYQIWSSVLGGFISKTNETGGKDKTNVYAGSAVIAEQTFGSVFWITADPLTGSSIKIRRSGAEYERKEYEPLGQEIAAVEPEEENPAPQGSPLDLARADDPQWQCDSKLSDNGFLTPARCEVANQAAWNDIYVTWEKKGNPSQISELTDSPLPSFDYSPSDEVMSYALASSSKKDKKPKRKKSSGAKADIGNSQVEVKITEVMPTIEAADASVSGADDWKSPFHFFSSDTKLTDEDCDTKMSRIFGGIARAMEANLDIGGINRASLPLGHSATPVNDRPLVEWNDVNGNGKKDKGEMLKNPDRGGIIHTYTDEKASARKDIALTVPGGWVGRPVSYYVGGNTGLIFNYSNGVSIEFVHVGNPIMPKNPGSEKVAEIGYIGGPGGTSTSVNKNGISYNHTHIIFFSDKAKGIRVDPRTIFCGW